MFKIYINTKNNYYKAPTISIKKYIALVLMLSRSINY